MSTSYKPALLKALVRIVRRTPAGSVPLPVIGSEFVRMYWNQTVVFHLRQAAVLTKEPEVLKAIRSAAAANDARRLDDLPSAVRARLDSSMARILTVDVLHRFHVSKPPAAPALYEWSAGAPAITLSDEALRFLCEEGLTLEAIANFWWARYLERVNILTPYIIQKVEREGAKRAWLRRFLEILRGVDDGRFGIWFSRARRATGESPTPCRLACFSRS